MATQGEKGQVFLEFILIGLFVVSVIFVAQRELSKLKTVNRKYQFSKDRYDRKMAPTKNRH